MNKIDTSYQKNSGAVSSLKRSLCKVLFDIQIYIGSFQPASSNTDLIEYKTKVGGRYKNLSTPQSTQKTYLKIVPAMSELTTGDLNFMFYGGQKTVMGSLYGYVGIA